LPPSRFGTKLPKTPRFNQLRNRYKKRASIRSVSPLTRSSIASTSHAGVNTSPWSATRFFDLIRLMVHSDYWPRAGSRRACPCPRESFRLDKTAGTIATRRPFAHPKTGPIPGKINFAALRTPIAVDEPMPRLRSVRLICGWLGDSRRGISAATKSTPRPAGLRRSAGFSPADPHHRGWG
jgi:hypothetical protein